MEKLTNSQPPSRAIVKRLRPGRRRSIEIVGVDRNLFSTDYPYQYRPGRDARRFLEQAALSEADMAKFAHVNWERLTGGAG